MKNKIFKAIIYARTDNFEGIALQRPGFQEIMDALMSGAAEEERLRRISLE